MSGLLICIENLSRSNEEHRIFRGSTAIQRLEPGYISWPIGQLEIIAALKIRPARMSRVGPPKNSLRGPRRGERNREARCGRRKAFGRWRLWRECPEERIIWQVRLYEATEWYQKYNSVYNATEHKEFFYISPLRIMKHNSNWWAGWRIFRRFCIIPIRNYRSTVIVIESKRSNNFWSTFYRGIHDCAEKWFSVPW